MSITAGVTRDSQGRVHAIKGQPSGGKYVTDPDRHRDGLTLVMPTDTQAQPERWPAVPNQDQRIRAGAEALRRSIIRGDDQADPNTDTNVAVELKRIAEVLAEQEGSYEAWRAGQAHHDDAAFDTLWNSDSEVSSSAAVTARLDELTEQHKLLSSGGGHPSLIIGRAAQETPADREMALLVAKEHIALLTEAIECGGRNLKINQIQVTQARLRANLAAKPF